MRSMQLEDQHWPVLVTVFEGRYEPGDADYFVKREVAARARRPGEPYVQFAVVENFTPTVAVLPPLGAWLNAHRADIEARCKGCAMVIPSTALRFLLSSLWLIARPTSPMFVADTREQAATWLLARMTAAGMPAPAYLRAMRGAA